MGDLPGIVERLDHLSDGTEASLGVEAIWLSPFFRSPMADFGYDIEDYLDVDPVFGTLADFDRLLEEAHRRDMRVVIDWVPNHTSDRHPWFVESRASRDSALRDWYVWRDPAPDGGPPNNWTSAFSAVGPAWSFDVGTGQWYLHSFSPGQPDLDWDNPEVEAAMHDVLRFWLDRGVDGFRMDVVQKIAKDPELRDNRGEVRHDEDWPTIHDRLRRIRAVLDEYDDRMMVGEVYLYDLTRLVEYVNSGDQLHLAHNFTFLHLPWDPLAFRTAIDDFEALSSDHAWPAWFLDNHDHSRIATRYGRAQARTCALLLYALRGTPFIYQGSELGLPDARIPADAVVDIDGRDPERAPIPWEAPSSAGPGAGFTTGRAWLPLVEDAETLAAERQDRNPASMLALTRRLAWYRRRSEVLQAGEQRSLDTPPRLLAFLRELDGVRLAVVLNFSSEPLTWPFEGSGVVELSTDPRRLAGEELREALELRPHEGVVVRLGD